MISARDLPVEWTKSSYSTNGGNCLETSADLVSVVPVRDSKVPDGAALVFPASAWSAFVDSVKAV